MRLAEEETVEVAMVGRDSIFGASAALDGGIALNEAVVQLSGTASVLDVAELRKAAEQSLPFRTMLIRHEQALFAQALQSTTCNASHSVESRLSRWLLRARDLSGDDKLPLTQERFAQMLGVQRSSVSIVANTLQHARPHPLPPRPHRNHQSDGFDRSSCECSGTVKAHYDRLLTDD